MPLIFTCPDCHKNCSAPERDAGSSIRCPGCGSVFMVPVVFNPEGATPVRPVTSLADQLAASVPVLRLIVWLLVIGWTAVCLARWAGAQPESAIHQAVLASQTAALVVSGYVIARGLTFLLREAESPRRR